MNKSTLTGVVAGVIIATAGGTIAGYNMLSGEEPAFAEVLDVKEVKTTVQVPREVCEDVAVNRQRPAQDQHKVVGTVAGAVLGGVLGNQLGGGSGRKLATVAGAVAGGYAGNKVQENMQANSTYTTTENRCHTQIDYREEVAGYDVSYRIGDKLGTTRMDRAPGARIPVEDGKLVLTESGDTVR
ncbi:MAG: glycine zipper 2TM domain-containing protein [Pseudomonadota bacterium]